MKIKIYLYKDAHHEHACKFPSFVLDYEDETHALSVFNQLLKDISFGNSDFIKCEGIIFQKVLFNYATLA